ncbi:Uncharacterized protein BM_BM17356 [Brugia malayi]|uniref:Uncharacterized protein n=1 Tax=Brugia malayi TaxID=6279 RepID=A0A4E9F3S2_BRUMA|nr:Uncharacterized protein BM_BM17356 [Brugia malayi]VIO90603.1 Uncharacterized protein BM_BM17356 [Brugia malayi]
MLESEKPNTGKNKEEKTINETRKSVEVLDAANLLSTNFWLDV